MLSTFQNQAKLEVDIDFEEVDWLQVLTLIIQRYKLSYQEASKILRRFQERILTLGHPSWYFNDRLSKLDNVILSAVGQIHSADIITLKHITGFITSGFNVKAVQSIRFYPNFRQGSEQPLAKKEANLELLWQSKRIQIKSLWQIMLLTFVVSLLGAITTATMLGLTLYGVAVLVVFIDEPLNLTSYATNKWQIGLALLCVLVGVAGIFGKAFKNIYRFIKELR